MMNLGSIGGFGRISTRDLAPLTALSANQAPSQDEGPRQAGHEEHHHHHHEHGAGLGPAMAQAFSALGVSLPTKSSGRESGERDEGHEHGSTAQGSANARAVKHDLRQFMHELFDALRNEKPGGTAAADAAPGTGTDSNSASGATGASAPATTGADAAMAAATTAGTASTSAGPATVKPWGDFASRLSALISDISKGSAPKELQQAFDRLASDLKPANTPGSGGATMAAPGGASASAASGAVSDASASGATVTSPAVASTGDSSGSTGSTGMAGPGTSPATPSTDTGFTLKNLLVQLQKVLGYSPADKPGASAAPAIGSLVNLSA